MPQVDSQENMLEQFVLGRVFATSLFSVESVRTICTQARVRDPLSSRCV